jgi:Helix-loop-helix DNA-binding domain
MATIQLSQTKSNYIAMQEGNPSQHGLLYPEEFLMFLSRKKNEYKERERARRGRLNQALKALEALMPSDTPFLDKQHDRQISKAGVVEFAIEYIRFVEDQLLPISWASSGSRSDLRKAPNSDVGDQQHTQQDKMAENKARAEPLYVD